MLELQEPAASRRRSVRRAVRLETEVVSDCWDQEVSLLATDLSPDGMWLQTPLPLDPGDEVLVSLCPPGWGPDSPLVARARVARVGMYRRRSEAGRAGMGLRFVDLDAPAAVALSERLRGLPPPLPGPPNCTPSRAVSEVAGEPLAAEADELAVEAYEDVTGERLPAGREAITLPDGTELAFQLEGALLTGGRPLPCESNHRDATQNGLAEVIPLPSEPSSYSSRDGAHSR